MFDRNKVWTHCRLLHSLDIVSSCRYMYSDDSSAVWAGIIVHYHKFWTHSTCIWLDKWVQNLILIPGCRHRSVDYVQLRASTHADPSPNHHGTSSIAVMFCDVLISVSGTRTTPDADATITDVQAKSGLVCEEDWRPLGVGLSDMLFTPPQACFPVPLLQGLCWSAGT